MKINAGNQNIYKDTTVKAKDSIDLQGQKLDVNTRDEGWRKMEDSRFVPDDKMEAILQLVKMAEERANKVMSYDEGNDDSIKGQRGYAGLGEDTGYVPTTAVRIDPKTGEVNARISKLDIDEENRTIVSDRFSYDKSDDGSVHVHRVVETDSFTEKNEKRTQSMIKEEVSYYPEEPESSYYHREDHNQTKTKNQSSFEKQKELHLKDHKIIDGFVGDKKDPNKKIKAEEYY